MNRPLWAASDGSFLFEPMRRYRLLVNVNGETTVEDLESTLVRLGFDRESLASSAPTEWQKHRPRDWPEEDAPAVSANECLVRVSGAFAAADPLALGPDVPIDRSQATFTVARAWDYAPSLRQAVAVRAGAAEPASDPHRKTSRIVLLGALGGIVLWAYLGARKRVQRKEKRLLQDAVADERAALDAELHALLAPRSTPDDPAALARDRDAIARALHPELAAGS